MQAERGPLPGLVPMARVIALVAVVHRVAAGVLDGHDGLGGPGWPVGAAAGLGGEGELGGGADRDREVLLVAVGQAGRRGGQGVAAERAGDLAAGEGGHAARGVLRVGGAGQRAAGVGPDGEGDRVGGRGHHVARLVLDADGGLGGPGGPVGSAAGLGGEDELGGRAGGDVERGAGGRR